MLMHREAVDVTASGVLRRRTIPGRQKKRQGDPTPCHFQSIAHPGACRKTRVMPHNRRPGPESTEWGTRNACAVVNVRFARGRRTAGGTRGAVAGTRRGGAGVRAAGLRGAAGRGRRAAGAGRRAGARAGARGDAAVAGRRAPADGRVDRHLVRQGRRGRRGMRCAGGQRRDTGRGRRAVGGRETGHPLRARELLPDLPAVAAPPAAPAAGPATPTGRDRQPGAVGA